MYMEVQRDLEKKIVEFGHIPTSGLLVVMSETFNFRFVSANVNINVNVNQRKNTQIQFRVALDLLSFMFRKNIKQIEAS